MSEPAKTRPDSCGSHGDCCPYLPGAGRSPVSGPRRTCSAPGCCFLGPPRDSSSCLSAWLPSPPLIKLCACPLHTGVLTCFRLPLPAPFLCLSPDAIEHRGPGIGIGRRVGLSYCLSPEGLQHGSSWLARISGTAPPAPHPRPEEQRLGLGSFPFPSPFWRSSLYNCQCC